MNISCVDAVLLIEPVKQIYNIFSILPLLSNCEPEVVDGLGSLFITLVLRASLVPTLFLQVLFKFLITLSPEERYVGIILSFLIKFIIIPMLVLRQSPDLILKVAHHALEVPLVVVDT